MPNLPLTTSFNVPTLGKRDDHNVCSKIREAFPQAQNVVFSLDGVWVENAAGTPEEVKAKLMEVFPDVQFTQNYTGHINFVSDRAL